MAIEETSDQLVTRIFKVTMVTAVLFVGAVFLFVL
jgi:hypothetical protein